MDNEDFQNRLSQFRTKKGVSSRKKAFHLDRIKAISIISKMSSHGHLCQNKKAKGI